MSWSKKITSHSAENRIESKGIHAGFWPGCFSAAVMLAVSLGLGACSWTFLPESADTASAKFVEDDIKTGSITQEKGPPTPIIQLRNLDEEDWRRAKAALAVALDPHGSTDRVLWDNPKTAAKGSFVPDGPPFVKNDEICRKFKTMISDQTETRNLQGTACQPSGGDWDITEIASPPKSKTANGKAAKPAELKKAGDGKAATGKAIAKPAADKVAKADH